MVSIMLDHLNIQQVRLITNNPLKIAGTARARDQCGGSCPLTVGLNPFNEEYLKPNMNAWHLYKKDDFFLKFEETCSKPAF